MLLKSDTIEDNMARQEKKKDIPTTVVVILAIFTIGVVVHSINIAQKLSVKKGCDNSDKIYVESTNSCREKTTDEKFSERCVSGITISGLHYTCFELKDESLQYAFLTDNLIKHGSSLYSIGTTSEIEAGKRVADYCISASDTWSHIGETRCVAFTPSYFAYQGYNYFLDEKKDYTSGFVVYMYGNYGWDWFLDNL